MTTVAPITAESILQEDGAEAALAEFANEVRAGEEAIRRYIANAESGEVWTFRGLRDAAAEGRRKTAMGVALMSLDKTGEVQIDYARSTVVATA
jgi:hypothetical protein